jgi:xanthosine phosphorylase
MKMAATPHDAANFLRARLGARRPKLAVVLGSGLGPLADRVEDAVAIPYGEIPGFHVSSVPGHAGRLVAGRLAGVEVACLQGRVHLYEGVEPSAIKQPIRTLKALGIERLVLTNAAGSFHASSDEGSLVLLSDHIAWAGLNPLVGPNDEEWGGRFFPLTDAYDPAMRAVLQSNARRLGIALPEGVYAWYLGPNFETPAEIRALRGLGADLVGMSTVPEVLVARHCGLRVVAISAITNLAAGMRQGQHLSHEHTQKIAALCGERLGRLIEASLEGLLTA